MSSSSSSSKVPLSVDEFVRRASSIECFDDLQSIRKDAIATENLYRELFSRQRDSWEVPEVSDDLHVFLVNVYENTSLFQRLPRFQDDRECRCFDLDEPPAASSVVPSSRPPPPRRQPAGSMGIVPDKSEFLVSWDCLTEGLLRFVNFDNVLVAGGAVAGCLAPLPEDISEGRPSATRVKRRKYFHDTFLPGSDIDLFLYGLDEQQAKDKLIEIFDAVQAANPFEIRAFRTAHAITLVSQYPFRHVQIVLRLYNSPSEVLMGFDVDACAVGFDGTSVWLCPRTALAIQTQSNLVDLSRRSPSYEMRLTKYAQRGFEVVVPELDRDRVDPFLYEKRFDQTQGLARLLLLERLRTPEERLYYKLQQKLQSQGHRDYRLRYQFQRAARDVRNLERSEGTDGIVHVSGAEASNYSTVFLPWGPEWSAQKIERLTRKKDTILNRTEFLPNGRAIPTRRTYKIHVCAVGTMETVLEDPFPNDPPIPDDVAPEVLEGTIRGPVSWLVDNPGRQQIGSFHPITDKDWAQGAYFYRDTEALIAAAVANRGDDLKTLLEECTSQEALETLVASRDFLGRSALHVAVLAQSPDAARALLEHGAVTGEFLNARLADGRSALHLAAMRGQIQLVQQILDKRTELASKMTNAESPEAAAVEVLDIDGADWEAKLSPLQYAITFGHVEVVRALLAHGANARKIAVHKDRNQSLAVLTLLAMYASECGSAGMNKLEPMLELLLDAGASPIQVDTTGSTCWHHLATNPATAPALEVFLRVEASKNDGKARALDIFDREMRTALHLATATGNAQAVSALLRAGATLYFNDALWDAKVHQILRSRGQSYGYQLQQYTVGMQAVYLRCPIAKAASNVDITCLEAYLKHDPSLANLKINVSKHDSSGQATHSHICQPLDLLEETRRSVQGSPSKKSGHLANIRAGVDATNYKVQLALAKQQLCQSVTYKHFVWSTVVAREQEKLAMAKYRVQEFEFTEEDELDEKKAIARIDQACKLVREAGGEQSQKHDETDQAPKSWGSRQEDQTLADPFRSFQVINTMSFQEALSMSHGGSIYQRPQPVPQWSKGRVLELMVSAAAGDVDKIQSLSNVAPVSVVDLSETTPFFLTVLAGSADSAKAIYEAATTQHKLFLEKQKLLQQEQEEQLDPQGDVAVRDQIRRLNNLDLAAGEVPGNAGPTPDEMRQQLEAAENAAVKQLTNQDDQEPPSSPVSPVVLLLSRSIVIPDGPFGEELLNLKKRLAKEQPNAFSDAWVTQPARLRPIELAIIKGDMEMVKVLFNLAGSAGDEDAEALGDEGGSESSDSSAGDSEEEEDWDDSDEEEGFQGRPRRGGTQENTPISLSELRFLLAGDGSRNGDLGGMTLSQLALAVDDIAMFCAVSAFGREHVLPRGAVAAWKREVDQADSSIDDDARAKRVKETDVISGESQRRYYGVSNIPLWASDEFGNSTGGQAVVHTTPVQFALSVGAMGVAESLMTGKADKELLGWILKTSQEVKGTNRNERDRFSRLDDSIKAATVGLSWICKRVQESHTTESELALRLFRPTAPDSVGRTALFYSPAPLVNEVVDSAVSAIVDAKIDDSASSDDIRSRFLESGTRQGFLTALKAAASAGEVEKVKALIASGCNPSRPHGPKHWNALHLAVPSTGVANPRRWEKARDIMAIILDGASDSERREMLVSPKAEHTPLMLAAERRADSDTISMLVEKAGTYATESLVRKDLNYNSVLHLAVEAALKPGKDEGLGGVKALLDKGSDVPETVGANVENARGVTPSDQVLDALSSVWVRSTEQSRSDNRRDRSLSDAKRQRLGKGSLPPQASTESDAKETIARETLSLLEQQTGGGPETKKRWVVAFDEVQKAKKKATEKARKSAGAVDPYSNQNNEGEESQSEPCGPPAVFPEDRNRSRRHSRGSNPPVQWNFWPNF